jgi:four helix bundle protein
MEKREKTELFEEEGAIKMKSTISTFEDLLVWQKGIEIVKAIYILTRNGDFSRDFALRDQIRRAAISIPTNIAEGFERNSRKEYLNFLNFAKGSAGEVRSLLRVASEIGYINTGTYESLRNSVMEVSRYLSNQIKAIKQAR